MAQRDTNYDRYFDFTECYLEELCIEGTMISVSVGNLAIWPGHPQYPEGKGFEKCRLIFEGVAKSERRMWEYIGDPPKLGAKQTIVDGPFSPVEEPCYIYGIEGVLRTGSKESWLNWEIESRVYRIEELGE